MLKTGSACSRSEFTEEVEMAWKASRRVLFATSHPVNGVCAQLEM